MDMSVVVAGRRAVVLCKVLERAAWNPLQFSVFGDSIKGLHPNIFNASAVLASADGGFHDQETLIQGAMELRTREFFWGPIHLLVPRPEAGPTLVEGWEIHLHHLPPPDVRRLVESIAASGALGEPYRQRVLLDSVRAIAGETWLLARTLGPSSHPTPEQLRAAIQRTLRALSAIESHDRFRELDLALKRALICESLPETDRISLQKQAAPAEEELRALAAEGGSMGALLSESLRALHGLSNELLHPSPKLERSLWEMTAHLAPRVASLSVAATAELPGFAGVLDPIHKALAALGRVESAASVHKELVLHLADLHTWLARNDPRARETVARSPVARIVLVEDHPGWRDTIHALLANIGVPLPIETVGDVEGAMEILAKGVPALVLVDLGLPRRPGLPPEPDAGLQLIRDLTGTFQGSHYRHRFVILTAATNYSQAVRRATELGVSPTSYLHKSPEVCHAELPAQVWLALQPAPLLRPRIELVASTERIALIEGCEIQLERHLWCLLGAFAGGFWMETGIVFPPRWRSADELALSLILSSVDPATSEESPSATSLERANTVQLKGDPADVYARLQDESDEPDAPPDQGVSDTYRLKRRLPDYVSKLRGRLDGAYRQARHQGPPRDFIESKAGRYRLNADLLLRGEVKEGPESRRLPVVLVVEDNEHWRSWISSDLEQRGMKTRTVSCLQAARSAVLKEPPDLISLDLELPSTEEELARGVVDAANSLVFLEFLQDNYPDIPVAVLTGIAYRDSVMPRILSAGVLEVDYIYKGAPDPVSRLATSLWRLWLEVLTRTRILDWDPDVPVHALHLDRETGILVALGPPSNPKPFRASGAGLTILKRLSKSPNTKVPRDELFNLVYPDVEELIAMEHKGGNPDKAFDQHIKRLRHDITEQTGIPGVEIVCGGKGGYYWLQGNEQWV